MAKFPVPDQKATVKANIIGLAICCYNAKYEDPEDKTRKGRWEVAIPRFDDHLLTINLPVVGILHVATSVKKIEIKDRKVVQVDNPKNEENEYFNRNDKKKSDPRDYRWLADFNEVTETTPEEVTMVKMKPLTMLYIYGATFYAELSDAGKIKLASHADSGQVIKKGKVINVTSCPEYHTGPVLDQPGLFGYIAAKAVADVHSPGEIEGDGEVDLFIDDYLLKTYKQGSEPQDIIISNMEKEGAPDPPGSVIITPKHHYGRGDFYRYYELFQTPDDNKRHTWEKRERFKKAAGTLSEPLPAKTGDCNGIRADGFDNLDGLHD